MFIAFEGIDGSGKSTHAKLLYESLRLKNKAFLTKEPTNGIIGRSLQELLHRNDLSPMAMQMLFAADREEHVSKTILPKLNEGYHVITDRYILSASAYGMAAGLSRERLEGLSYGLPRPTFTFIMDISAEKAYKRLQESNKVLSIYENLGFLGRARTAYADLANGSDNYFLIDSGRDVDKVSKEILKLLGKHI